MAGKRTVKVLICGGLGQLGNDCTAVLKRSHEILSLDVKGLDITNLVAVDYVIKHHVPDVIVNCAAYTNVDECETEEDRAFAVNVEGPRNLAVTAKKYGQKLIHISTDYVFDGKKRIPEPYIELDEPCPLSCYGKTKYEGERAIRQTLDGHMIVRTAWLYGLWGHNFLKTILKLALKQPQEEIRVVNDQCGSPTWSYRLSIQIARLIETKGQGTYHATSEGYCTWYEFGCHFLETMGIAHSLVPCTTHEYPTPASRPMNSILENRHLKEENINLMPDWRDDLDEFVSMYRERLIDEAVS